MIKKTHPCQTSFQCIVFICPVNTPCLCMLSIHPVNTLYQHILSTQFNRSQQPTSSLSTHSHLHLPLHLPYPTLPGELNCLGGAVRVKGSVAYVPQSAWIPNDVVRYITTPSTHHPINTPYQKTSHISYQHTLSTYFSTYLINTPINLPLYPTTQFPPPLLIKYTHPLSHAQLPTFSLSFLGAKRHLIRPKIQ